MQQEGEPCEVSRDYDGVGECDDGLVCYDSHSATYGSGVCTRLIQYAKKNQVCDIDFGVNACIAGYACYDSTSSTRTKNKVTVGVVRTGLCQYLVQRSGFGEVCDVSFDTNACVGEHICLGANGREIGNIGIGICAVSPRSSVSIVDARGNDGEWYVDYSRGHEGQCVMSCDTSLGSYCGGTHANWEDDEVYSTADYCCTQKLWWMSKDQCVPNYYGRN